MPAVKNTRTQGSFGERYASNLLLTKGYQILARNFHSHFGEIDIIALDQETLVFVEVKTRFSTKFGLPEEAVTPWKLKRITKTADYYCLLHPDLPKRQRIEVVAIQFKNNQIERVKHIRVT